MKATKDIDTELVPLQEEESCSYGAAQVATGIILILSALIGAWGVSCLIGGVSEYGLTDMLQGWLAAVTGR